MTCIAAVIGDDGKIYMGGDSAGINVDDTSLSLGIGRETKVWKNGGILFGACGSFRVSQVLRWHMDVPPYGSEEEAIKYITGPFIDAMRDALSTAGSLETWEEDSVEGMPAGVLLGYNGRVFEIWSDFGVGELIHDYGAAGCGAAIACGSLATTEKLEIDPKQRIKMALGAAERHSAGVRGPMVILTN